MSKILISHTDLDGIGSIVLSEYFGIHYDKIICLDYNIYEESEEYRENLFDGILYFDEIHFTDFSPSEQLYKKLVEYNKSVIIFDHHESSEWLTKQKQIDNIRIYHDKTRSGTKLYFDEYIKKRYRVKPIVEEFVTRVDIYDRYETESEWWNLAQDLNRIFYKKFNWFSKEVIVGARMFINMMLKKFQYLDTIEWSKKEWERIQQTIDQENKKFEEGKNNIQFRVDEKGVKYALIKLDTKISIVCSRLLKSDITKDCVYITCINTYPGMKGKISLRSRDEKEFDCTQIANGHKCAAGLQIDPNLIDDFWNGKIELEYKEE